MHIKIHRPLKSIISIVALCFISFAFAKSEPLLVLDATNVAGLPKNFRQTSDLKAIPKEIPTKGLKQLHAIGSAQFSEKQLQTVLKKTKKPLTIVDLRQESHGFIHGNAVSWYSKYDWGNIGKSPAAVEQDQAAYLGKLPQKKNIFINKITGKTANYNLQTKPLQLQVGQVQSEAEIAKRNHVNYIRLYVTDGMMPDDTQVDRFVKFERSLPTNMTLYFHCRAGKGRTTTFMALHDMLHNAKQVSLATILQRQKSLGGIDLLHLPKPSHYKYKLQVARVNFLNDFYRYAATNKDHFKTTWLQWKKIKSSEKAK